mgnify:CR=1 FL=1
MTIVVVETASGATVVSGAAVDAAVAVVVGATVEGGVVVGGGAVTVNENEPSIGCASCARTTHRTPTGPPASGGSNTSTKTLLSSVATDDGLRTTPVGSSTVNPSPVGVASPVNRITTSLTTTSTTSPSAGTDDSKAVWAAVGTRGHQHSCERHRHD